MVKQNIQSFSVYLQQPVARRYTMPTSYENKPLALSPKGRGPKNTPSLGEIFKYLSLQRKHGLICYDLTLNKGEQKILSNLLFCEYLRPATYESKVKVLHIFCLLITKMDF